MDESTKFQRPADYLYFCDMKIREIKLPEQPLLLAPMEDITDAPFRQLCKRFGADLVFSEFVSADALIRNVKTTLKKLHSHPDEHPYGIQLYGKEIEPMVEAARVATEWEPDLIDLNFGCPVRKVAMKGAGAGLLRDIPLLVRMTAEVVKATPLPVTVKTRLGWDDENKIIVELAEMLQDVGIAALTIHGRTRAQLYSGQADWSLIGEVKRNPRMHIPIIGNGDIDSALKAREAFDKYGVDAVMIGRAAIGRPWIFREIRHFLNSGTQLPAVTVGEQVDLLREYLRRVGLDTEEGRAVRSMRKFFAVALKGLPDFKETRVSLLRANTYAETEELLKAIVDRWGDYPAHSA